MKGILKIYHPEETLKYHIKSSYCKAVYSNKKHFLDVEIITDDSLDHVDDDSLQYNFPQLSMNIIEFPIDEEELDGKNFEIIDSSDDIYTEVDLFDNEEDDFTGFMSSEEITDIDDEYIYTVITKDDILKMVNQLDHSMGGFMDYFAYACILAAALIIYLLTKLIIEKNATSISMVKVLGYTNNEISSLYVRLTTYMVIIFSCGAAFIGTYIISFVWKAFMNSYPGWYEFYIAKIQWYS